MKNYDENGRRKRKRVYPVKPGTPGAWSSTLSPLEREATMADAAAKKYTGPEVVSPGKAGTKAIAKANALKTMKRLAKGDSVVKSMAKGNLESKTKQALLKTGLYEKGKKK